MRKALFINKSELIELFEQNFGVQADTDVIETVEEDVEITKDVVKLIPDENIEDIIKMVAEALHICHSEITVSEENDKNILYVDFYDISPIISKKYNVDLTSRYESITCDLFDNDVFVFEIR